MQESGTWTDVHFCACNASDPNCENSVFRAQLAKRWAMFLATQNLLIALVDLIRFLMFVGMPSPVYGS